MEGYREAGMLDPDYESYTSAVELNEEEDKKENLIKVRQIIDSAYSKEILQRQQQIEQIELQICKVRKVLHLLRYALITSYYKKKELECSGTEDEPSTSDLLIVPDKQNRIHPAVKKLLGENVHNLNHLNFKDKRKRSAVVSTSPQSEKLPESKKIKLELEVSQSEKGSVLATNHDNFESIRSRKKTKYRVVVGNISKWMPSSEDDVLTHKWMVYVRGPKDKPDVSHFIDKVVYYLHPSYKPHDVIEVCESPFHLSRRGWGEFPVRVQIFFKVTLNKPIDIVHNIKLDKTCSGRQTLGNETVVDVFLYDDNNRSEIDDIAREVEIKIKSEVKKEEVASTEHDYCSEVNEKISVDDHLYCLSPSHEGLPKPKKEKIDQDETNRLIYGLDMYYQDEREKNVNKIIIPSNSYPQLVQLNRKDIKFNNTKIIVFGKKVECSLLTNFGKLVQTSPSPKPEIQNFKITFPKDRLKNMGEALAYMFKKLPLYTELATNCNYKRLYPFSASSLKEYVSWNVGKRRSSEWSRANLIRKILSDENISGVENWNTKAILMYGRSHDYTPFISYGLFSRDSDEKNLLMECYSSSSVRNSFRVSGASDNQEIIVNVDSDSEVTSPKKQEPTVDITDPHSKLECSYIRHTALNNGIILKPEEIIEGVRVNGAEMMILEAIKCLADNLIRRAKNHRVCTRNLSSNTSSINKEDVEVAINERPEMFHFRHLANEKRNDFF